MSVQTKQLSIDIKNIDHVYAGRVRALDNVSLQIDRGEFVAIIGKNGSGKTTLSKHLNGLLKPTNRDGQVHLRTHSGKTMSTRNVPLHRMSPIVGYVFQNPDRQIFHDTCREELEFGPRNIGHDPESLPGKVTETLRLVGLAGYEETNPVHMSRGQRQRLAIAATLVMDPEVAVIDEPTTGQDRHESQLILDFLARFNASGKTIVIVSHDMALVAEYATRVIAMQSGSILADSTPRDIFAMPEVLETTNIRPPQVTVLGSRLGFPGLLTVDEAVETLAAEA